MSVGTGNALDEAEIVAILARVGIFSTLSHEDLRSLGRLLQVEQHARGEVVIHQGDFGDSIYFIWQGEVEVFVRNEEGAESTLALLGEGDVFGEMALLTGSPRSASVKVRKDAFFLILYRIDFDEFVKGHPHLAIVFSKLLAERIRTTNQRYLQELTREGELKKLLVRGEEQRRTRLVGTTKQSRHIEKKIEELAGSDEPVLLAGPEGTAGEDVARLVHLGSHRHDQPFLVVDVAGGDEWRAWRDRAGPHAKNEENAEGLFEEFQISAIFGHESGAVAGTRASRLGYVELADGGTIVLKNVDRLSPGTRERLFFYLLEKKFYRLGGLAGINVDARVIATTNVGDSITDEEMRESLRGKIPEVFWKNKVDLPSLALRRRDIPMIAEAFLEKYAASADKSIKTISAPAMNTLIRYTWPGNDRELENVIERGVLVCDGDTLLPEHIFLGLTPYSEKGRVNLLRLGSFRKVFANLKLRAAMQAVAAVAMIGVVCLTLFGAKEPDKNLGMGMVWYYWWPFLLLSFLFLGRFYCSVCPIHGLTKLSRALGSLNRSVPRVFKRIDVGLAAVLVLALFWGEHLFQVKEITVRTAIFLAIILASAIIVNVIFRPEVWCRYVCPWGYFSGVCACLALVELRANNKVCSLSVQIDALL